MEKMAFEMRVGNETFDRTKTVSGIYIDADNKAAEVGNGMLAIIADRTENEGYTGRVNESGYKMKAASASDTVVYAAASVNAPGAEVSDSVYRIGIKLGATIPAGECIAWKRIDDLDIVAFGEGSLSEALSEENRMQRLAKENLSQRRTSPRQKACISNWCARINSSEAPARRSRNMSCRRI